MSGFLMSFPIPGMGAARCLSTGSASSCLLLLATAGVGVFIYGHGQLNDRAVKAQQTATNAEASRSSLQNLSVTEKFLAENSDVVNRASQLVADSKAYVYQDQIIQDINKFATEANVEITDISFDDPVSTPVAGQSATTPTAPSSTTDTSAKPANVKSIVATVSIKSPTSYSSLLTFIHSIEQSLFRMQISKIGLSHTDDEGGAGSITSDTLTIEAYIR